MKPFSTQIIELRIALLKSIKAILATHSIDEISVSDVCDRTYITWRSNKDRLYAGELILAGVKDGQLYVVLDTEEFTEEITLYEDDEAIRNPCVLDSIRDNILEAIEDAKEEGLS